MIKSDRFSEIIHDSFLKAHRNYDGEDLDYFIKTASSEIFDQIRVIDAYCQITSREIEDLMMSKCVDIFVLGHEYFVWGTNFEEHFCEKYPEVLSSYCFQSEDLSVFFKCPVFHFEGLVKKKIGFSFYEVEITKVIHTSPGTESRYVVGKKISMSEDEFNKEII